MKPKSFEPRTIVQFRVDDLKLVPWSAVEIGTGRTAGGRRFRHVTKNKKLQTFQEGIARFATAAMGGKPAHGGPCSLDLSMIKRTADETLWGSWCYVPIGGAKNLRGDLTNLVKAVEDALQTIVYESDQLVCYGRHTIVWGEKDTVHVTVSTLNDQPRGASWRAIGF